MFYVHHNYSMAVIIPFFISIVTNDFFFYRILYKLRNKLLSESINFGSFRYHKTWRVRLIIYWYISKWCSVHTISKRSNSEKKINKKNLLSWISRKIYKKVWNLVMTSWTVTRQLSLMQNTIVYRYLLFKVCFKKILVSFFN